MPTGLLICRRTGLSIWRSASSFATTGRFQPTPYTSLTRAIFSIPATLSAARISSIHARSTWSCATGFGSERSVAHALVRAASALVPTQGFAPSRCREESRHGTHECVRHVGVARSFHDGPLSPGRNSRSLTPETSVSSAARNPFDASTRVVSSMLEASVYRFWTITTGPAASLALQNRALKAGSKSWYISFGSGLGTTAHAPRSEERRVGKECRSRWSPY